MPTKKQLKEADRLAKTIDWSKYDAMSDAEIRRHWAWDKDMTWPTAKELAEFDLVIPAKSRRKQGKNKSGKTAIANRRKAQRKPPKAAQARPAKRQVAAE